MPALANAHSTPTDRPSLTVVLGSDFGRVRYVTYIYIYYSVGILVLCFWCGAFYVACPFFVSMFYYHVS